MKMSPKFLLLIIGLIVVGSVEAKSLLKRIQEKESSFRFASKTGDKVNALLRRRRDVEEATDSSSEEEGEALMKFFIALAWQEEKVDVLSSFLEEVTNSDTNLTVVGWQRILDDQGKVKQIHTIQLVIPPKPEEDRPHNIVNDDDDDDDDDLRLLPHKTLKEIEEFFGPMNKIGMPASVTMEEFESNGDNKILIYMDRDELYAQSEGFALYNKTSVATPQEVSNFITSLKPAALGKPSILKYDVDENLLVEQSNVKPHLLGCVTDHYEASDDMLLKSPQIIAQIYAQYDQEEIPKQLALAYNKEFPQYKWRVLVSSSNYWVTRDVSVTVAYDNFDLDETSDVYYHVYGVKKNSTNK